MQKIGMSKNVPTEINDPVWRQSAAQPWLWWCQSKTLDRGLRSHKHDRSQKKKAISWIHWKLPQWRPLTMHNSALCLWKVFFFFFFLSAWQTNPKKKKIIITGETRLFPLPVSLLVDDGMQEGIVGAQVERKRQSVTSQVARRKISQTNVAKEFTARTGSVLAKWDAAKGCHSAALVSFHMNKAGDAPELKTHLFVINIHFVWIFLFFLLMNPK